MLHVEVKMRLDFTWFLDTRTIKPDVTGSSEPDANCPVILE
jgi:hypothetical protein